VLQIGVIEGQIGSSWALPKYSTLFDPLDSRTAPYLTSRVFDLDLLPSYLALAARPKAIALGHRAPIGSLPRSSALPWSSAREL